MDMQNETAWLNLANNPEHLIILGRTMTGKSLLAKWLASHLNGKLLVVDPCHSPQNWNGFDVIGNVSKGDIMPRGGDYAITQFLNQLVAEINKRCSLLDSGCKDFENWNIILDELIAIATNESSEKQLLEILQLLPKAKKVKIRFLLISQSVVLPLLMKQTKPLFKQEYITFIRLGELATRHAEKLKNKKLLDWLQMQQQPCLINDKPAVFPNATNQILSNCRKTYWGYN